MRHITTPSGQFMYSTKLLFPLAIDLRNTKETAMLKRNLGGFSEIPVHNLLYDANQLRSLAQLQESLEWFSKALLTLVTGLKASNANSFGVAHLPKLSENSIKTLTSRALEFEELSDTCLLVLHLEVRVHCFHYLHSIWKGPAGAQFSGGHDSTEPNLQVKISYVHVKIPFSAPLATFL